MYLLDALPTDLTADETTMLQHRLPEQVKTSITASPQQQHVSFEESTRKRSSSATRSYLHRLLASTIIQVFLLVRLLLPYLRLLLRQVVEYERSHRITERIVTKTLDAADGVGRSSADIGSAFYKFNEGRVGAAVGHMASWWIEGVAGGIYEGVGEGMMQLGFFKQGMELDTRLALQVEKH